MGKVNVILVSTGLGRIRRGFETYIHDLACLLHQQENSRLVIKVYGGGKQSNVGYHFNRIPSIFRESKLSYRLWASSSKRLRFERFTFFLGMIPTLLTDRPDIIYLGEYPLYCWLYKLRKLTGMRYRLALYTGGQAIPGRRLFHPRFDFIHHVTDVYINSCQDFPKQRQMLVPHFVTTGFKVDNILLEQIKRQAAGKKIVLSVGAIEKSSKRMHWLVKALANCEMAVFPILLGEPTADWDDIEKMLQQYFGKQGYILKTVSRPALGTYYKVADLFVSCSPKESFGLVFVEALNFGLPVICDDFQEVRFVLKEHATYTTMTGPDKVALAIQQKLSEEFYTHAQDLTNTRKQFVASNYSMESLAAAYIQMFNHI